MSFQGNSEDIDREVGGTEAKWNSRQKRKSRTTTMDRQRNVRQGNGEKTITLIYSSAEHSSADNSRFSFPCILALVAACRAGHFVPSRGCLIVFHPAL